MAGTVTIDYLTRAVACAVAIEGVLPITYQAPFGSLVQEILTPASALHAFAPELIVLAPTWRDLIAPLPVGASAAEVDAALAPTIALYRKLWSTLAAADIRIIQHTLVPPANRYRGPAERLAPAAPANQVRRLNDALLDAGQGLVHFLDLERIAGEIGSRRWSASRFHYTAKLDFDPRWLPEYLAPFRAAAHVAGSMAKPESGASGASWRNASTVASPSLSGRFKSRRTTSAGRVTVAALVSVAMIDSSFLVSIVPRGACHSPGGGSLQRVSLHIGRVRTS